MKPYFNTFLSHLFAALVGLILLTQSASVFGIKYSTTATENAIVQYQGPLDTNDVNQFLLRIELNVINGGGTPPEMNAMAFDFVGGNNVSALKLYTTDQSPVFNTSKLLGTFVNPTDGTKLFNGNNELDNANGLHYYWLVVDMKSTITNGAHVDASYNAGFEAYVTGPPAFSGTDPWGYRMCGRYYTIGTGEDYLNLDEAANGISQFEYDDNDTVFMEFMLSYTNPAENTPIVFKNHKGPAYIVIRPDVSRVSVVTQGDPGTGADFIAFDGTQKIILDGRSGGIGSIQWTMRNSRTIATVGNVIHYKNDAINNMLTHVGIEGEVATAFSGLVVYGPSVSTGNDDNTISNCYLSDIQPGGGNMPRFGIYSNGDGNTNDRIQLLNNYFYDIWDPSDVSSSTASIRIRTGADSWDIKDNHFFQTVTYPNGIATGKSFILIETGGGYTVTGNYMGGRQDSAGGPAYAITSVGTGENLYGIRTGPSTAGAACTISGNTIGNINFANDFTSAAASFIAIRTDGSCDYIIGSLGQGNTIGATTGIGNITVTNNIGSSGLGFKGIKNSSSGNVDIDYNTFGSISIAAGLAGSTTMMIENITGAGTVNIRNNTIGSSIANNILITSNSDVYGISNSSANGATISGNMIQNFDHNATVIANVYGISNTAGPLTASGNTIQNIATSSPLQHYMIEHSGGVGTISGNLIQLISQQASALNSSIVGIYTNSASAVSIANNTIGGSAANNMSIAGNSSSFGMHSNGSGTITVTSNTIQQFNLTANGSVTDFRGISNGGSILIASGNTIQNNTVSTAQSGLVNTGIYTYDGAAGHFIEKNTIKALLVSSGAVTTQVAGIFVQTGSGEVSKNFISELTNNSTSGSGEISGIHADASGGNWDIYNNVVILDNGANLNDIWVRGIDIDNINTTRIYHNTVKVSGSVTAGSANTGALSRGAAAGTSLVSNNIFQNFRSGGTGKHYAELTVTNGTYTSNNNYVENSVPANICYYGADYTLAGWQGAPVNANNTISGSEVLDALGYVAPGFAGANLGANLTGTVDDDKNSISRDGTPWMGAYEGATGDMLYFSSTTTQTNTASASPGTLESELVGVEIACINPDNPIDLTAMYFNTNGTSSPANDIENAKLWTTGTSGSFATTNQVGATVAIPNGVITFSGFTEALSIGTNYFWLTYDIKPGATACSYVDAQCDSIIVDDTTRIPTVTAPIGERPLGKVITVGASRDFTTIQAAYNSIPGVIDDTYTILLYNDYSAASETYPITFGAKATATYGITIRPASGATGIVTESDPGSGGQIMVLNDADYITLEGRPCGSVSGREWIIRNKRTAATEGSVLTLINDATNNTFSYVIFEGESPWDNVNISTTTGTTGNDDNTFSYCYIRDLTVGGTASFPGRGISCFGTAGKANDGIVVDNCHFIDQFDQTGGTSSAIAIANDGDSWTITNNHFYQSTDYAGLNNSMSPIMIFQGGGYVITGNYIGGNAAFAGGDTMQITSGTGRFFGISFSATASGNPNIINGNTIANIRYTTQATAVVNPIVAIELNGPSDFTVGTSGNGNIIGKTSGIRSITLTNNGVSGSLGFIGILNNATGTVSIAYNSIGGITIDGSRIGAHSRLIENPSTASTITIDNNTFGNTTADNIHLASNANFIAINSASANGITITNNTFQNITHDATVALLFINNSAGNFTFNNNTLDNIKTLSSSGGIAIIQHSGATAVINGNSFSNITFEATGVTNDAMGIFSTTTSPTTMSNNTFGGLTANNITDRSEHNFYALLHQGTGSFTCDNNTIQNVSMEDAGTAIFYGIKNDNGTLSATGDTIRNITSNSTGASTRVYGIFSGSNSVVNMISKATIQNLNIATTTASGTYATGIWMETGSGILEKSFISGFTNKATINSAAIVGTWQQSGTWDLYNNVILLDNGANTNDILIYGIFHNTSGGGNIYHNTVSIDGTATGSAWTTALRRSSGATGTDVIRNNIFQNLRSGGTGTHHSINSNLVGTMNTDFNYLETTNSSKLAYYNTVDYTLAGWQGAPVNAANSISGTEILDAVGMATDSFPGGDHGVDLFTPVTVIDDFLSNIRDVNPWLGAYEGIASTCSDGYLNQGETDVDCGGPCPVCPETICNDALDNDGDTQTDCFDTDCFGNPICAAATSTVAEISPNNVATNSLGNSFSYDIQVAISGGNSGVDRVAITVPGTFGAPTVISVEVDGVPVAYTDNTLGNAISVDLIVKVTATSKITILFDADAPTTQDLTGVNFLSTIDDLGTLPIAVSTTEGDGDGDAGDNNSWTVTTTDPCTGNNTCATACTVPIDGTCLSTSLNGSTDSRTGIEACQSGNNPEVWFTATSNGTDNFWDFTVNNLGAGFTGTIELIIDSGANCLSRTLVSFACDAAPLPHTLCVNPNTQYWWSISSGSAENGVTSTFDICVNSYIGALSDFDSDGIDDVCDNCVTIINFAQTDADADGYGASCDCDDTDAAVNPGAVEVCDGIDNNCVGGIDEGFDTDGDGFTTCGGDCDDIDINEYPGQVWYPDCDGDTYYSSAFVTACDEAGADALSPCGPPSGGWSHLAGDDCNDGNASINPGAGEVCDGIDNNCDASTDEGYINTAPTGATASVNPTCGGATDLTVTGGALGIAGTWEWYSGSCGGTVVGSGSPISVSPVTTTTYYIRAEGCNITACASVTVTVNPVATVTAGANDVTCESIPYTLAGSFGGGASSITWSNGVGDGLFDDNTLPGATYSPGAGDILVGVVTLTITTDDPAGPCLAANDAMTLTINSDPITSAITGLSTVCESDVGVVYSVTNTIGSSYSWTIPAGAIIIAGNGTNAITVDFGNTSGNIEVTETNAGLCVGVPITSAVTVNLAATTSANTDQTTCEGSSATMAGARGGSATTSTWTSSGDGSFDNTALLGAIYTPGATDIVMGSVTLTITTDDPDGIGPCLAVTDFMVLTIDPAATATAGADASICDGDDYTLSGGFGGSASAITWSSAGDGSFDNLALPSATYTPGAGDIGAGTVVLTIITDIPAGPCTAASDNMTLTINPGPSTSAITGSAAVCENDLGVGYSVTNTAGSSYAWGVPAGATIATGAGTNAITVNWGSTSGNVTVTETDVNGCVGAAVNIAVTVNALPGTSAITGSTSVCNNAPGVIYSVANTGGSSYAWTVPPAANITAGAGTNSISVIFGTTSGNVQVTETNAATCVGSPVTLAVTVSGPPAVPSVITGTSPVCQTTTGVAYSVTNVAGVTYAWSYSGAGFSIASGAGTNAITADFSGSATSGTLIVTPSTACGTGSVRTFGVTINPVPAQPSAITGTTPVCKNTFSVAYSVTNVGGVSYAWTYSGAGFSIVSGAGTSSITADFSGAATSGTLTVTPSNGCGNGSDQTFAIVITDVPAQPSAITGSASVCRSDNGVAYSVTNVGGVSYAWTYSGAGFSIASGAGTNAITANFSGFATSGTLTVTPSTVCGSGTVETLAITVNTLPTTSAITGSGTVCENDAGVPYSVTNTAGSAYAWSVPVGATITAGAGTNAITVTFASTSGIVGVTETNTAGCLGSFITQAVTVDLLPNAAVAGTDQAQCNLATATLAGNVAGPGAGVWTSTGTALITIPASETSGVTGLTIGTKDTLIWTISNGSCPSSIDSMVITVDALPTTANAGVDQSACGTTATLAGNAVVTGTGLWTALGITSITTPTSETSGVTGLPAPSDTLMWTISNGVCPSSEDTMVITTSTPLAGVYTIGGGTPDYISFTTAVADLVCKGISAPVRFDVRNGTYTEQISIPEINGASANDSIVFQSESGDSSTVILTFASTGSAANYTLNLDSVDYFTFRNMTVRAMGLVFRRAITFAYGANNINISNNEILGAPTTSLSVNEALVFANGRNDSILFENNKLVNGAYAIRMTGGGFGDRNLGVIIRNNKAQGQYARSLYTYYVDGVIVSGNTVTTNSTYTSYYAIHVEYCDDKITVTKNTINALNGRYGIYINECYAVAADSSIIANNFIQAGSAVNFVDALSINYSEYHNIVHNSVNVTSMSATARAFSLIGGAGIKLFNNIFVNDGAGYAIRISTPAAIDTSDHNDLYSNGTNLGYWGVNVASFATWQSLSGQDANSDSLDPLFTSATDLHLTIPSPPELQGGADLTDLVPDDIDDDVRPTTPTMGADQFIGCAGLTLSISDSSAVPCSGDSTGVAVATPSGGTAPFTYLWDDPSAQTDSTANNLPLGTYKVILTDANGCQDSVTTSVRELTNSWTQRMSYGGTARYFSVGFSIGSKGYIGTGNDGVMRKDFWEYDPVNDTWAQVADFGGTARHLAVGFSIGNKGYIGTGNDGANKKDFWQYNPSSNSWTQKASFDGTARNSAVGFSIGDKGYIGTGYDGAYKQDFWAYDTTSNTWTQMANFGGLARSNAVGFSIGNRGYIGTGSDGVNKQDFWAYDTTSNTWVQKSNFGGPARFGAVGFSIGSRGYIGTGTDGSDYQDFWEYDTTQNAWNQKADFTGVPRYTAVGFSIGNRGYIGTGYDGSFMQDFWEYTPILTGSHTETDITCFGGSDGAIDLVVSGVFAPQTYLWSPGSETSQDLSGQIAGTYTVAISDSNACQAFDTITLTEPTGLVVSPGSDDTLCVGESTTLGGAPTASNGTAPYTYSWVPSTGLDDDSISNPFLGAIVTTTTYTLTVTDAKGCVGIDSVTYTTNAVWSVASVVDICAGDSLFIEDAWQNTSGIYRDTLMTSKGCDSVITTTLTVNPTYANIDGPISICFGDSVSIYGIFQLVAGTYYDSLTSVDGCDSVHSTVLTVNPTYSTVDAPLAICVGDSVSLYGTFELSAGTYYDSLTSVDGCDSVHSTILTVNPAYNTVDAPLAICAGDSISIYGTFELTAGTYYDSLTSVDGCDSVHSTVLTVNPIYNTIDAPQVICTGDSLSIYGTYELTAGTYYDSLLSVNGCDSVHSTVLAVSPTYNFVDAPQIICAGDSILIYGSFETIAGTYYDSLISMGGCDSVHSTVLSINPTYSNSDVPLTICTGDSVLIYGTFESVVGTYYDTLASVNGCDSIRSTVLTLSLIYGVVDPSAAICAGDSILIYGSFESTVGTYYDSLTSVFGCDSVHSKVLSVLSTFSASDTVDICAGDSAFLVGSWQSVAGSYVDTLSSVNGCDSIVTTELQVNPVYTIADAPISICNGDSVSIYGTFESVGGTYYDSLTTINGCDSVLLTVLSVDPSYSITDAPITICSTDSSLIYGSFVSVAGTYYDSLTTGTGCDSIHSTVLTVNLSYALSDTASICGGDSMLLGGAYQTTAGTYVDTFPTINLCDSIVSTTLSITPIISTPASASICTGDSILLGGAYQSTAGSYVDSLTASSGCDSIVVTLLSLNPVYLISLQDTICGNDSVFLAGAWQNSTGIYFDTLTTISGCDSVIGTTLQVKPSYTNSTAQAICLGDSMLLGGVYQTTAGTYIDTLNASNGCDSIISTTLIVNGTASTTLTLSICSGDSVLLSSAYQTIAGLYIDTLAGSSGCDSVVQTTLIINPTYSIGASATLCSGDSVLLGGFYQTTAGVYQDTLSTTFGCDSIVSTTLTIPPGVTATLSAANASCFGICDGAAISTASGGLGTYTYSWNDPALQTTSNAIGLCAGWVTVQIQDSIGCAVTDSIEITEPIQVIGSLSDSLSYCKTMSDIVALGGSPVGGIWTGSPGVIIASGGDSLNVDATPWTLGTPYELYFTFNGCTDTTILEITGAIAPADTAVCPSVGLFNLSLAAPANGTWSGAGVTNLITGEIDPTGLTGTIAYVYTSEGCPDTTLVNYSTLGIFITDSTSLTCFGDSSGTLLADSIVGGSAPFTYLWNDPNSQTDMQAVGLVAGNYSVIVTDGTGCQATTTASLSNPPAITGTYTDSACVGDSILFFGVYYQSGSTYQHVLTAQNGCDSTVTLTISSQPCGLPIANFGTLNYTLCEGECVNFSDSSTGGPPTSWLWTFSGTIPGSSTDQNPVNICYTSAGTYSVKLVVTNSSGQDSITKQVTVYPAPIAQAGSDVTIGENETTQLFGSGGLAYQWTSDPTGFSSSTQDPFVSPFITTDYILTVSDLSSCIGTDTVRVTVVVVNTDSLHIYNIFSPNGDGTNDLWVIDGISQYPVNHISIYNRWESEVMSFDNYDNINVVWNGENKKGNALPSGTYFYVIDMDGRKYTGWVEITY